MNEKPAVKPKRKIFKIFLAIIGVIIAFNLLVIAAGTVLRAAYFKGQYAKIMPYGKLVDVYDGKMHVYSAGSGSKTIVLIPGMGIALPSADFGPLMRKLAEKNTAVCVEYFGTGFSSGTKRERTCANYTEEIREALKKGGFKPPYVLMAHSISSVYAEYYAAAYPREVTGIISLDGTGTGYYEKMPDSVKKILPLAKLQQSTGVTGLLAALITDKKKLLGSGYTGKEINDMIVFAAFTINDTLIEQILNSSEAIKEVMDMPYPESVPYFKIISKQTYETPNAQLKMTPQEYQKMHLDRIGKHAKYEILDGSHFIYLNNTGKIAAITDAFLKQPVWQANK